MREHMLVQAWVCRSHRTSLQSPVSLPTSTQVLDIELRLADLKVEHLPIVSYFTSPGLNFDI